MQTEVETSETEYIENKTIDFIDFVQNLKNDYVSEMLSLRVIPSYLM